MNDKRRGKATGTIKPRDDPVVVEDEEVEEEDSDPADTRSAGETRYEVYGYCSRM
jgi:hypothetical protein